jgi:hypothetical protein
VVGFPQASKGARRPEGRPAHRGPRWAVSAQSGGGQAEVRRWNGVVDERYLNMELLKNVEMKSAIIA